MRNLLWYKQPAVEWEEALPLGNGNIGAMVFGRVQRERIALNDDTLWSGYPKDKHNPDALEYLPKVQKLVMQGKLGEARDMANLHLAGLWTECYLPLGDLEISTEVEGEVGNYLRDLDISKGIATTSFEVGKVRHNREAFVSAPAQALVMEMTAAKPTDFRLSLSSQLIHRVSVENGVLYMRGRAPDRAMPSYDNSKNPIVYEPEDKTKAIRFAVALQVQTDGVLTGADGMLKLQGATRVVCRLNSATSFNGFGQMPDGNVENKLAEKMALAKGQDYAVLRSAHVADFSQLFDRVDLDLGHSDNEKLDTIQRLEQASRGAEDPDLVALLFQFGRYLMISGSRPGTTPTNLQGIWNQHLRAPWCSNYTININTEMNYWLAENCNLSECAEPLISWMQVMAKRGRDTAKNNYGARGWVSHHNSDIWAHTDTVGPDNHDCDVTGFSLWPMSSGWFCETLWEHYQFTGDEKYLAEKVIPVMFDAARFYLDFMVEDENGYLVTVPSSSPENKYDIGEEFFQLDVAPTMDTSILKALFANCLEGAAILDISDPILEEIRSAIPKLPPFRIGRFGQLQEWSRDYDEHEPEHRHVSHLYGLYPSNLISVEKTPELAKACEVTLNRRGFDSPGWSMAWKVCLWARLGNGENAYRLLRQQLRPVAVTDTNYEHGGGSYPSLLGAHPPFQIDGNYGFSAAVAEMLVQSHGDTIQYLPAIPKAWKKGYVRGLRVRGGKTVDIRWEDGKITEKNEY